MNNLTDTEAVIAHRQPMDPEILALLDRRIAEINELADRIERAQAAPRAYLIA